ncbi:MAG: rhodanese-like domain-containing protein [Anaerolineae bacterium]
MKKLFVLLAVLLLAFPAFGIAAQDQAVVDRVVEFGNNLPRGYGLTDVETLNALLSAQPNIVLLDVREAEEYAAGHIPGSFNIPIRTLSQNLNLLPNLSAQIVVICKGGGRAMLAGTSLEVLGYTGVQVLKGGNDAWVGAELPQTTDAFVPEAGTAPEFDSAVFAAVDAYLTGIPEGYGLVGAAMLAGEMARSAPVLIDVRSDDEWNLGYIDGAQHIWINEFVARMSEWPVDKDTPIVVYCQSGYRGGIASVLLHLMGYTNVRNLAGGVNAWSREGLPLTGVPFSMETHFADTVAAMPDGFNGLSVADAAPEITAAADTGLLVVDVRTADEYSEGFIPGAINIPLNELTQHLDMLPTLDQPMIVYCGSGHRSAIAMTSLTLLGYTNVRSMMGGYNAWTAALNPITTAAPQVTTGAVPAVNADALPLVEAFLTSIPQGYYTVRPADLATELAGTTVPTLIDVRTPEEYATGYIAGAINIPLRDLFTQRAQWPTDTAAAIVLYDSPTHRSSIAMVALRLLGYTNVRVLGGGVNGWTSAEQPLVTP